MTAEQPRKIETNFTLCEYNYLPSPNGTGIVVAAEKDEVRYGHIELLTEGHIGLEAFPGYALIADQYVFPHRRKQGIGTSLLHNAIHVATSVSKKVLLKLPMPDNTYQLNAVRI